MEPPSVTVDDVVKENENVAAAPTKKNKIDERSLAREASLDEMRSKLSVIERLLNRPGISNLPNNKVGYFRPTGSPASLSRGTTNLGNMNKATSFERSPFVDKDIVDLCEEEVSNKRPYKKALQKEKEKSLFDASQDKKGISKRLFKNPANATKKPKILKGQNTSEYDHGDVSTKSDPNASKLSIIQQKLRPKYRPTPSMQLSFMQELVALYAFATKLDPSDVIFKNKDTMLKRRDILDIPSGRHIDPDIIRLMALKLMIVEKENIDPLFWAFPPSFAEDIQNGATVDNIRARYISTWMPQSKYLRYVFIPICENGDHWYLMVVSLQNEMLYRLDSFKG
ncbi:hypothetical protein RIF29_13975 [Crotalaria pallida]|uniref:Ubiquitin-like protease family profile domain-containing protein n=1 Tax=Crotalaria pallida TaxID=3830 RepID=A0AAN9IB60_CROPI